MSQFDIELVEKGWGVKIVSFGSEYEVQGAVRIPNSDYVAVSSNGDPLIFRLDGQGESNPDLRLELIAPESWILYSKRHKRVTTYVFRTKKEAEDNCDEDYTIPARLVFE